MSTSSSPLPPPQPTFNIIITNLFINLPSVDNSASPGRSPSPTLPQLPPVHVHVHIDSPSPSSPQSPSLNTPSDFVPSQQTPLPPLNTPSNSVPSQQILPPSSNTQSDFVPSQQTPPPLNTTSDFVSSQQTSSLSSIPTPPLQPRRRGGANRYIRQLKPGDEGFVSLTFISQFHIMADEDKEYDLGDINIQCPSCRTLF